VCLVPNREVWTGESGRTVEWSVRTVGIFCDGGRRPRKGINVVTLACRRCNFVSAVDFILTSSEDYHRRLPSQFSTFFTYFHQPRSRSDIFSLVKHLVSD